MKSFSSLFRYSLIQQKNFLRNLSTDFEKAKLNLEKSSVDVDNETKLKLYGLFKQSTQGVCSTPKPGLTDFVGRAKWTAWSSLGKMTQEDAQKQYVQTVEQLISSTNSTKTKNEENPTDGNVEHIELNKKSAAHWEIVLNRPEKYNAITQPMYERIIQIFDQASQDKQLILLSFTAKGKFYSSGTDLADFAKMAVRISRLSRFEYPFFVVRHHQQI